MAIDLFRLVFEEFLRISPTLINKYPTVQDQLLYLILIPHAILFLFLAAFGLGLMGRVFGRPHPKLQWLIIIVTYIYIIWSGWYGSWIVPFTITWFYLALIVGLFVFFVNAVFSMRQLYGIPKIFGGGGKILMGVGAKEKALEKLERERRRIMKRIEELNKLREEVSDKGAVGKIIEQRELWIKKLHEIDKKIEEIEESW